MNYSVYVRAIGFCLFLTCCLASALEDLDLEWQTYKRLHSKQYRLEEELARFTIWKMNAEIIDQHNRLADQGVYSYWLKMNSFGDLVSYYNFNLDLEN